MQEKDTKTDSGPCKYCGTKGLGKDPNYDLKKAHCAAFQNMCKQYNRQGNFEDICTRKPKTKGVDDLLQSDIHSWLATLFFAKVRGEHHKMSG